MEPKAAEVVPKAIIKEAVVAPTLPKATSETIAKAREKLQQGAYQESLKIIQAPPIEQKKISEKLEQFGITRNATTGAKELTTDETTRRNQAETGANLAKKFIENGYDKMDPAAGGEQEQLRAIFLDAAKLRPFLEQEMQGMNDVQKKAFAERYLKDPRFTKELRAVFDKLLDPSKKLVDISTSQDAKEKADLDLEDAKAERQDHNRVWEANDRELKEYEVPPAARRGQPAEERAKWQRLQGLTGEISATQNSLNTARSTHTNVQREVKTLQDEFDTLQRFANQRVEFPAGSRSMPAVQTELNNAKVREAAARDSVSKTEEELRVKNAEKTTINQEYESLLERRTELDTKKRTLERTFKDKEREATKRQWALQDAKTVRVGEEQDLTNGFKNIFSEVSDNILNNEVEKANTAYNAELEVLKQQTTDNNEKAMYSALQEEMLGDERVRKKGLLGFRTEERYRPISKSKVNAHHDVLMTKGPEENMRGLLATRINPATGVNYTASEVNEILVNKDYVNKMQPEVVKQILARKMLTGGISKEDIHVIVNSQWGQGMIEKAKESNAEFRKAVEADMGPGALSSPNFHEKLAEKIRKHPWWLLLILGIPALVGTAALSKSLQDISK